MTADDVGAEPELLAERRGGVLLLTLNRPDRLNAMRWSDIGRLARTLAGAAADDDVRCVVLTGAGRAFSAGGDVHDQVRRAPMHPSERLVAATPLLDDIRAIDEFPKPLVAAVNGVAAGAGIGLALMSDIRLAARSATFGLAFGRIGLGPDFGLGYLLPRVVGPGAAARLLFTAARIDAGRAAEIGLVDELHADDDLLPAALRLADEIAAVPPFAARLAKLSLRRGRDADFATALQAEMWGQHIACATDEHRQAVEAFTRADREGSARVD